MKLSDAAFRDAAFCNGFVIASQDDTTTVLTSAHCLLGRSGTVIVEDSSGVRRPARNLRIHPQFKSVERNARYDLATLEVSNWSVPRAVPFARIDNADGSAVAVVLPAKQGTTRRWIDSRLISHTRTAFEIDRRSEFCFGSSGAPAVRRSGDGFTLSGLISSGITTCTGNVIAARTDRNSVQALLGSDSTPSGPDVATLCASCVDSVRVGGHVCEDSLRECNENLECRHFLHALDEGADLPSSSVRNDQAIRDVARRMFRCVCLHGCVAECKPDCERLKGLWHTGVSN